MKLDFETLSNGLSKIGYTYDKASLAYHKLDINNVQVNDLGDLLGNYPHLRYVNLAFNCIENVQILTQIPHILSLNLSHNKISTTAVFNISNVFNYLTNLDLSHNQVTDFAPIELKRLKQLNLSYNQISVCSF